MIYSEIFRLFFIVTVFLIDLAKGELRRCIIRTPRGIDWVKLPLPFTIDRLGKARIIYPDNAGYFKTDTNTRIVFACIKVGFMSRQLSNIHAVEVRCYQGTTYIYNGKYVEFSEFMCNQMIPTEAKKSERTCRPNNNTVYNLGYRVSSYFFTLYSVCFDENNYNTLYSWYQVRYPFIDHYMDQRRTDFVQENIYGGLDLESIYGRASQRLTINKILKINSKSEKFVKDKDIFLSKGHLTSKTDFYYGREQVETFNYLNAFPQWYKSNQTWAEIENVVKRELGKYPNNRRVVISGVYGSFTLPDKNGEEKELYLVMPGKKVAVPKFHWKMIYDADNRNNNIVYISYNNPTSDPETGVTRDLNCAPVACPGIINNNYTTSWMRAGIIYCCTITAFQGFYGAFNGDVFAVPEKITFVPAA